MRSLRHRYELPVEPRDDRLDVTLSTVVMVVVVTACLAVGSLVISAIVRALTAMMVVIQ